MSRLTGQANLGLRWLTCGRRIFVRNPWLLGGMGLWVVLLMAALTWVPFVGSMLVAFLAPLLLAGFYLALDAVTRQKMSRPVLLHKRAFKQSPRELFSVFREERNVVPAIVAALYCTVGALLANVLIQVIAGSHWTKSWVSLSGVSLGWVIAATFLALVIYFMLSWPLIYGLPLAFLQRQPLFPAMRRSVKASVRNLFGLLVIFVVLLLPVIAGALASLISMWLAYVLALLIGAITLPMVAASLYCSYRTVFPQSDVPVSRSTRAKQHTFHRT